MSEEKHETHAEIIAEVRFHAQQNIDTEKGSPTFGILTMEGKIAKDYADRLEAAHKREVEALKRQLGNMAKMREAVEATVRLLKKLYAPGHRTAGKILAVRQQCESALAAPARNCDMFGGDPKRLHDEWWGWSGKRESCNEDGTVKMTYGEWLLAAIAKGANDGK